MSNDNVVIFREMAGINVDDFDDLVCIDELLDEGIVIFGNSDYKSYGRPELIAALLEEYGTQDENENALTEITGKRYLSMTMAGSVQGELQYLYFPEGTPRERLLEIEASYFGLYRVFVSEDDGCVYSIPDYIIENGCDEVKAYLADAANIGVEDVRIRLFEGYQRIAKYSEAI